MKAAPPPLPVPPTGQEWDARLWGALVVLCGVLFLDGLDVSMVGVALPSIGADLDMSTSTLQWVVSGYVLGYGGLLLLGGRFADLLGRRRVLLAALAVFTAASVVGGLVDDGTLLVITRFLKGAAAAFTAPASLSIITTTFAEGPARNRALAIYTACGASGFSLGLVFGGLLTELGWRWTFLLPVPIALALLVAAPRVLAKDAPAEGPRRGFDFAGAATITAAMLLLVRTVVEAPEAGWGAVETVGGFAVAALLLAAFVAIEQRSAQSARAARHPALGLARQRQPGHGGRLRRVRGIPVRRHAVPAADAGLVTGRDRARVPARRPAGGPRRTANRPARRSVRHRQDHPGGGDLIRDRLCAVPADRRVAHRTRRCSCRA